MAEDSAAVNWRGRREGQSLVTAPPGVVLDGSSTPRRSPCILRMPPVIKSLQTEQTLGLDGTVLGIDEKPGGLVADRNASAVFQGIVSFGGPPDRVVAAIANHRPAPSRPPPLDTSSSDRHPSCETLRGGGDVPGTSLPSPKGRASFSVRCRRCAYGPSFIDAAEGQKITRGKQGTADRRSTDCKEMASGGIRKGGRRRCTLTT